jgi:predicted CopG family antitoxin
MSKVIKISDDLYKLLEEERKNLSTRGFQENPLSWSRVISYLIIRLKKYELLEEYRKLEGTADGKEKING